MPFVLQTSLDDDLLYHQMRTLKNPTNRRNLLNLHQNIQDVCNERIEIMSPHYRAARDGNKSRFLKII
jgi:hypothetical protein